MRKDPVPELLARAIEALETEFGALPEFEAEPGPGASELAAVLEETASVWATTIPTSILSMPGRC